VAAIMRRVLFSVISICNAELFEAFVH
jgi:hypothetical protein